MVSGHAPIRATKLRYHLDRNFTVRLLPPPQLGEGQYLDRPRPRSDDWSRAPTLVPEAGAITPSGERSLDSDDGGLQRRPAIDLVAEASPADEHDADALSLLDDDSDVPSGTWIPPSDPDPRLQRRARFAAFDPADGIPL